MKMLLSLCTGPALLLTIKASSPQPAHLSSAVKASPGAFLPITKTGLQHRVSHLKKHSCSKLITDFILTKPKSSIEDRVFEKVEAEASISPDVLREYITRRLENFLDTAGSKIPDDTYLIRVQFIVERDGTVSRVIALDSPGYGLSPASVAAIRNSPKWNPAQLGNKEVRSYHTQPITFIINNGNGDCDSIEVNSYAL